MQKIDKIQSLIFFVFASCLFGSAADAYIPPSSFILKTWAGKHVHHKKLKVKSLVTSSEGSTNHTLHFKEILVLTEGPTVRSWAVDDSDQVLFHSEKGLKDVSLPGQLLFSSDAAELGRLLKLNGIPILTEANSNGPEKQSMMRWNDSVSWVIAEKPVQAERPQIWFEKDTFLPVRLVYSAGNDSLFYELSLENYRDFSLPRSVSLRTVKGKAILTSQVLDVSSQVETSKSLRSGARGWTVAGEAAPAELKALIRTYYESFR